MSCDHPDLLPLDEALARLWAALPAPASSEVRADRDDPAADLAAMDGVALRSEDGRAPRRLLGTLYAGDDPAAFTVTPGTAVRIMTGAALPAGADAILPVEQLRETEGLIHPQEAPEAGDHVRRRGGQAHAGDLLLPADQPMNVARTALRAWVGRPLPTLRRIRVAVASTGDELVADPAPHQIRDSNGPMLAALAHALGAEVERRPALPDDPAALAAALRNPGGARILMTSGGVSMGEHDHLPSGAEGPGRDHPLPQDPPQARQTHAGGPAGRSAGAGPARESRVGVPQRAAVPPRGPGEAGGPRPAGSLAPRPPVRRGAATRATAPCCTPAASWMASSTPCPAKAPPTSSPSPRPMPSPGSILLARSRGPRCAT